MANGTPSAAETHIPQLMEANEADIQAQPEEADIILPTKIVDLQHIINGEKNYEFRKVRFKPTVRRVWFYEVNPHSRIEYFGEIDPPITRGEGHDPIDEDGVDNRTFNEAGDDSLFPKHAYKILSLYRLSRVITMKELETRYNIRTAPKAGIYVPRSLLANTKWQDQEKIR